MSLLVLEYQFLLVSNKLLLGEKGKLVTSVSLGLMPDNLTPIPWTHIKRKDENQLHRVVL